MGMRGSWQNVELNPYIEKIIPTKDTNPKDAIGATKLPLSFVPSTGIEAASLAFLEGALKYGRFNWRIAGVRTSIYFDAAMRHLNKYWNGEYCDPQTRVPHLASVLACIMIIIDADQAGKLTDDRPPKLRDHSLRVDDASELVSHLKNLFKDKSPHQYTILDSVEPASTLGSSLIDGTLASNSEESCPSK